MIVSGVLCWLATSVGCQRWLLVILMLPESEWPSLIPDVGDHAGELEYRKCDVIVATTAKYEPPEERRLDMFLERQESWYTLKRRICLVFKLIQWLAKVGKKITVAELNKAGLAVLKYIQKKHIDNPHTRSQIQKLFPVTKEGIVRAGGRLDRAPLNDDERHPILVPQCQVAKAIAWDAHINLHAGSERMLSFLNKNYWILGARRMIRRILYNCHTCRRIKAPLLKPLMGQMPLPRVKGDDPPFTSEIIDWDQCW